MIENRNSSPSPGIPPKNLPVAEDPLKDLLKREEIKTMAKDTARLREGEAKAERERISTIKPEPVPQIPDQLVPSVPSAPAVLPIQGKPLEPPEVKLPEAGPRAAETPPDSILIPKTLARKSNTFQKILVRGGLIVLFVSVAAGSLYFFANRNKPEEIVAPSQSATTTQNNTNVPELSFPQSLIAADQTKIVEISGLSQALAEKGAEGKLVRILVKNSEENNFLRQEETFPAAFGFSLPSEITDKLEKDYTLALFGQKEGVRLAFITKTKDKQGLINSLKKWEPAFAEAAAGKKENFKTAASQGTLFRYLTLDKNDFGICYLVVDDYFVLTNSFGAMQKIIKELNLEKKLGQLLMVGFEGKTLTPELTSFFKKYRPGALLLLSKNVGSKEQLKTLASQLQTLSLKETGLPLLIAADQEGGEINRMDFLEEKTPQKEIGDSEKAFRVGESRGKELKELGINLNLAPVLDWATAGDFLFGRSFQKPAETSGELAKSLISGQKQAGILTSIKHFPGYSGITFNPENKLAELEAIPEISQFQKSMEAGPEFVMTSNVIYKEINSSLPFSFSPQAIQFLKTSLGENVLVLSDDLAQDSLTSKFSLKEVMRNPIEAGVDILIFSGYKVPVEQGLEEFLKAYKNGEISKEKAEKAVNRITQLKQNLLK